MTNEEIIRELTSVEEQYKDKPVATFEVNISSMAWSCRKHIEELAKENAELKAQIPQWHDLRINPNDLPNANTAVLICFRFEKWTTTYIAYYRPAIKKWQIYNLLEAQREPIVDDYIDSEEVIAWCELPQFKE